MSNSFDGVSSLAWNIGYDFVEEYNPISLNLSALKTKLDRL